MSFCHPPSSRCLSPTAAIFLVHSTLFSFTASWVFFPSLSAPLAFFPFPKIAFSFAFPSLFLAASSLQPLSVFFLSVSRVLSLNLLFPFSLSPLAFFFFFFFYCSSSPIFLSRILSHSPSVSPMLFLFGRAASGASRTGQTDKFRSDAFSPAAITCSLILCHLKCTFTAIRVHIQSTDHIVCTYGWIAARRAPSNAFELFTQRQLCYAPKEQFQPISSRAVLVICIPFSQLLTFFFFFIHNFVSLLA